MSKTPPSFFGHLSGLLAFAAWLLWNGAQRERGRAETKERRTACERDCWEGQRTASRSKFQGANRLAASITDMYTFV
jgi:hypothetical protein